jgi:peptidyl-prolyl cis-trans isomerase C
MTRKASTSIVLVSAGFLVLNGLALSGVITGCGDKKADETPAAQTNTEPPAPEKTNGLTKEQAAEPIAKVGATTITVGEFADRLSSQSPYLRARYSSPERKREFLDNMVRFELLAIEAEKRGLDKQPEVDRVKRQMMVQQMMTELFDEKGVKLSDIPDAEIEAYYKEHAAEFNKPEQRRASHILCKTKPECESVLAKLKAGKADDMELFRKLADQHNTDAETKERQGDLRFFSQEPAEGEVAPPKAVRDAVWTLAKNGDVFDGVVESDKGFHVVKRTGERPALARTLEDARRLIQNRLWREKREAAIEAFVADLRKKAEVKENLDALAQVKVDLSDMPKEEAAGAKKAPKKPETATP